MNWCDMGLEASAQFYLRDTVSMESIDLADNVAVGLECEYAQAALMLHCPNMTFYPVVKELIQNDFTKKKLRAALVEILNPTYREQLFSEYYELETLLGGKGASERVAKQIVADLKASEN